MFSAALVVGVSGPDVVIVEVCVDVVVSAVLVVGVSAAVVVIVEVVVGKDVSGVVVCDFGRLCVCRCFCCTSGGCFRNSLL